MFLAFLFRITGRKQLSAARLTVPDAKVHGLCSPNHPNGQEHVVADLSCLESVEKNVEKAFILCVHMSRFARQHVIQNVNIFKRYVGHNHRSSSFERDSLERFLTGTFCMIIPGLVR